MTAVSALTDSEITALLATWGRPCSHPIDGVVGSCIDEGCRRWELDQTAYRWRKGDPVYQGGAS